MLSIRSVLKRANKPSPSTDLPVKKVKLAVDPTALVISVDSDPELTTTDNQVYEDGSPSAKGPTPEDRLLVPSPLPDYLNPVNLPSSPNAIGVLEQTMNIPLLPSGSHSAGTSSVPFNADFPSFISAILNSPAVSSHVPHSAQVPFFEQFLTVRSFSHSNSLAFPLLIHSCFCRLPKAVLLSSTLRTPKSQS